VGIGALLFMKEKPTRIFWVGTAISLVGVTIIIGLNQILEANLNVGSILAIIASMFYGAYLLTVRKGRINLDTFSFTAISTVASTLVLGLICLFTSTPLWGFSTKTWLTLGTLGIVPQLLGWLAINQALGHIRPTVASVSLLSQTVFTAIFSVFILGEVLTVHEIGGALVVLAGIYLVNRRK
jgi:drug/metabolite transporter (DMT)-like permease